jgi:hypothetical protein
MVGNGPVSHSVLITSYLLTLSCVRVKANISLDAFNSTVSFGEDVTEEDFMRKVVAVSAMTAAG